MEFLPTHLLVVGLPESDKSTFLAALYHLVTAAEVDSQMKLVELHGNREHVSRLHRAWLACEELGRTSGSGEGAISLRLRDVETGSTAEVVFPDLMGETFRAHFTQREWTKEYDEAVRLASGLLLFIHPERLIEPVRIEVQQQLAAVLPEPKAGGQAALIPDPWDPERAPTQVQLVDLLQMIEGARENRDLPLRVAVIVSAWDLVSGLSQPPDQWIQARLPLLNQFLTANDKAFSVRLYGVSAQGDSLAARDSLLAQRRPSERASVVGDDAAAHDLTAPVRWVLSDR